MGHEAMRGIVGTCVWSLQFSFASASDLKRLREDRKELTRDIKSSLKYARTPHGQYWPLAGCGIRFASRRVWDVHN